MLNISISAWNSSSIIFTPRNCNGTGWAVNSKDGGSGRYLSCTSARTPSARLSFTGSSVYYISTYFENQTIQFCLDGICAMSVGLSPPRGISSSSNVSRVMWNLQGLEEIEHTLELFPPNNGSTLVVDTIVYTVNERIASSSSSSSSSKGTPPIPSATSSSPSLSTNGTLSRDALDNQTIGLVMGTVAGTISGLVLLGLIVMMCRRRRELNDIRHYHSGGTFKSRFDDSVHRQTQKSHRSALSFDDASFYRSADGIRPLSVPLRVCSSAARQIAQSPRPVHVDPGPPKENQRHSEANERAEQRWVNRSISSQTPNYPKLEPLRKPTSPI